MQESSEQASENKITSEKEPAEQISSVEEEDKYEAHSSDPSSSGREPPSGSSKFESSTQFRKKSSLPLRCGQKRRRIIAEISSEIQQKQDRALRAAEGFRGQARCPNCGPGGARSDKAGSPSGGQKRLNSNQEMIYKHAIKRAQESVERHRDVLSRQNEQIRQYRIKIREQNSTINEMTRVIMELAGGDLQNMLDQNED